MNLPRKILSIFLYLLLLNGRNLVVSVGSAPGPGAPAGSSDPFFDQTQPFIVDDPYSNNLNNLVISESQHIPSNPPKPPPEPPPKPSSSFSSSSRYDQSFDFSKKFKPPPAKPEESISKTVTPPPQPVVSTPTQVAPPTQLQPPQQAPSVPTPEPTHTSTPAPGPPQPPAEQKETVLQPTPVTQPTKTVEGKLLIFDINDKKSNEFITYLKDASNGEDVFIPNLPHSIFKVKQGNEVLWTASNQLYPDEIRVAIGENNEPKLKVYFPPAEEPKKPKPQVELIQKESRTITETEVASLHLTTVNLNRKRNSNKIKYEKDEIKKLERYTAKAPYMIEKVVKGNNVLWPHGEITNYAAKLIVKQLENGKERLRVFSFEDEDEDEDEDEEDKEFGFQPRRVAPETQPQPKAPKPQYSQQNIPGHFGSQQPFESETSYDQKYDKIFATDFQYKPSVTQVQQPQQEIPQIQYVPPVQTQVPQAPHISQIQPVQLPQAPHIPQVQPVQLPQQPQIPQVQPVQLPQIPQVQPLQQQAQYIPQLQPQVPQVSQFPQVQIPGQPPQQFPQVQMPGQPQFPQVQIPGQPPQQFQQVQMPGQPQFPQVQLPGQPGQFPQVQLPGQPQQFQQVQLPTQQFQQVQLPPQQFPQVQLPGQPGHFPQVQLPTAHTAKTSTPESDSSQFANIIIITKDENGKSVLMNPQLYDVRDHQNNVLEYSFSVHGKCTSIRFGKKIIWKHYLEEYGDSYPQTITHNKNTNKISIHFSNFVILYQKDTEGKWNDTEYDVRLFTQDPRTRGQIIEMDSTKYNLVKIGDDKFEYTFKPNVLCTEVHCDDQIIWKTTEYDLEEPKSVTYHEQLDEIIVGDRTKNLVYYKLDDGWPFYRTKYINGHTRPITGNSPRDMGQPYTSSPGESGD